MLMQNRVYGVVGIKSLMSNWNADFTGNPKQTSDGQIFGSDKAFKYPIKKMWQQAGEKVLYIKSYKIETKSSKGDEKEKIQPKDLAERYEEIFSCEINDKTPSKEVLKNLFSAIDVINFGATFAEKKQNISITGAVQVGQGFNKYSQTNVVAQNILSPFRNSNQKSEDKEASTMGTKITVDEAHYFYPFSVNPENYNDYVDILKDQDFQGYTQETFEKFKAACLVAATAHNTNSKSGSENEFALFVYCKAGSAVYLPNLDQYIAFDKQDDKNILDFCGLTNLLEAFTDKIEKIELYYNEYDTNIINLKVPCEKYNLFSGKEIKEAK